MRCFLFAGLACLIAGCSGGASGTTITGKVTFGDGSPLTKGVVVINGESGSSRGAINPDGTFTLENVVDGEYQVGITGAKEGGEAETDMQYDEQGNYIESKPAAEPKSLIADKYSDPTQSGLTLKVPSDKYEIQVEKP